MTGAAFERLLPDQISMHNAKPRGRRPEAYQRYVEDRAISEGDKIRRGRWAGMLTPAGGALSSPERGQPVCNYIDHSVRALQLSGDDNKWF